MLGYPFQGTESTKIGRAVSHLEDGGIGRRVGGDAGGVLEVGDHGNIVFHNVDVNSPSIRIHVICTRDCDCVGVGHVIVQIWISLDDIKTSVF